MLYPNRILGIVSLALAMLVFGCSLGPTETSAPRSYLLDPEMSWDNPHRDGNPIGGTVLLISQPKAQAGFDSTRMAYLLRPYEINYYAYNQWADTPARMLQQIMVDNLDKSGRWSVVRQTSAITAARYRLDCDSLALQQEFFSRPSRIRLTLRAQLIDLQKPGPPTTRHFEVIEAADSDDPYGGVLAGNRAAARLLNELAAWLATSIGAQQ